ncbi:MAG: hypothetical protein KAI47_28335, partial [Deltaproteobacteria bacterium]|nr:hypothetical protein [Deltaproteobacteria bacterium]
MPTNERWAFQEVGNPLIQMGNTPFYMGGGTINTWKNGGLYTDSPGVVRLIQTVDTTGDAPLWNPRWDVATSTWIHGDDSADDGFAAAVRHKDNDTNKGMIVYLGGHDHKGAVAGNRLFLNTLFRLAAPIVPVLHEVTRSSPITKADPGVLSESGTYIYQGTWVDVVPMAANPVFNFTPSPVFDFPATAGHLRVYDQSQLTSSRVDFDAVTGMHWDGADQIMADSGSNVLPVPNDPASAKRVIFTAKIDSSSGTDASYLSLVNFDKASLASGDFDVCGADGAFTKAPTAETDVLVDTVRKAKLGGIDRSDPIYIAGTETLAHGDACLGTTPFATSCRPVMVYTGALDGMVHAFATADIEKSGPAAS